MKTLHFPGRDVPPQGESVPSRSLVMGEIYFRVGFLDKDLRIPEMQALVFIGRDLEPDDAGKVYFQDAGSYRAGVRYDSEDAADGEYQRAPEDTPFVYEFERALDRLLYCSLTRTQA